MIMPSSRITLRYTPPSPRGRRVYNVFSVFLFLLVFLLSTPVFSLDVVTNLVGNTATSQNTGTSSYLSGDVWLRQHLLDKLKFDFDLYFEKSNAKVNVAQAKFLVPDTDIIVGRQQMGWGVGYLFNPLDVFNPIPVGSSLDPAYVRYGRDAIVINRYFGIQNKLQLLYAGYYGDTTSTLPKSFQPDWAIKLKTRIPAYDLAFSYINRGSRTFSSTSEADTGILGLELTGTTFYDLGLWLEYARYIETGLDEYVLGTDYYWGDWHFVLEYYKNGFGQKNSASYDLNMLLRGRMMAQDYLVPLMSYTVDEKLTLTEFTIWNMNDGGVAVGGIIDYLYNDNIELILMPVILKGDSTSEYGIQKAAYGRYALTGKVKWVF